MIPSKREIKIAHIGVILLTVLPLLSLKSGGQSEYLSERQRLIQEVKEIQAEVKKVNDTISVIDAQIKYKDSIDAINYSNEIPDTDSNRSYK